MNASSARIFWRGLRTSVLLVAWVVVAAGCVSRQAIDVQVSPSDAALFVDGEERPAVPRLELRSDRDHSIYIKRDGYRPELVVLRSVATPEGRRLEPSRIAVALRALGDPDRRVEVEAEAGPGAE